MAFGIIVTRTARKPPAAAFEFYRDDVERTIVMSAPCLVVDDLTVDLDAVDRPHRVSEPALS
jgi:hypothetical protein